MTTSHPVVPVPASTVILVREERDHLPWEVFMVRRHVRSDFAADVYVFPGGKVDEVDRDPRLAEMLLNRAEYEEKVPVDGPPVDFALAAIRELFEEAGVLLACRKDGTPVRMEGEESVPFAKYRNDIHAGTLTLLQLARDEGLVYPLHWLHPFSRWITPETFPRRFDTWFFVARMPSYGKPTHEGLETTDSLWISPEEALNLYHRGDFPLVFATQKHLERLAQWSTLDELLSESTSQSLEPVIPRILDDAGKTRYLVPGDPDYELGR